MATRKKKAKKKAKKKRPAAKPSEEKCYHFDYTFEVLTGPYVSVQSTKYPLGKMNIDLRDVMYLQTFPQKGEYRYCSHRWDRTDIKLLLRYVNTEVTISLNSDRVKAFREHWQLWHNTDKQE